jgi:CheY-like chemotaxis protein
VGDAYVRATVSTILAERQTLPEEFSPRAGLYRVFHAIWSSASEPQMSSTFQIGGDRSLELDPEIRAAVLLTAVEGFSTEEAAFILEEAGEDVVRMVQDAEATKARDYHRGTRVLIIEDEPLISLDLEELLTEMGHVVVASASTREQAVLKARKTSPQLILADINLGEGGSGIEAVTEILQRFDVPVIFVTAYPELLLTGERPEPTYLIAKPFLRQTVRATIEQALLLRHGAPAVLPAGADSGDADSAVA